MYHTRIDVLLAWVIRTLPIITFFHSVCFKLPLCFLVTVALLIVSIALIPMDPRGDRRRALTPLWARCMLWICGIEVRVRGLEKLDGQRQYIFVSNHASWVDIAVLIASLPQHLCFLAKTELFRLPLVGTCLRRSRQIPIDRQHALAAASRLREAARILPQSGRSLVLFPEGTRSSNGLLEFKIGAAYLGIQTGIPMVPAGLNGTCTLMPRGSAIIRSGTVHLCIGEPRQTEGLTHDSRGQLTQEMRRLVGDLVSMRPRALQ